MQKFLSTQGIILKKKNSFNFGFEKFKTLYLTGVSGFLIILIAFTIPIFDSEHKVAKNPKINESNKKFKEVLEGGEIENKSKIDEGLDLSNILEDVFSQVKIRRQSALVPSASSKKKCAKSDSKQT